MEKERKTKMISLAALIVAVLGLTVAFAAMSQTLTINGTASLNAAEWDIHFENLISGSQGEGTSTGTPIIENGTTITGIDAVITKPEDGVQYMVDIKNAGTINAEIASVEMSKLCTLDSPVESCDWDNDGTVTQTDIDKVKNNITFDMVYETCGMEHPKKGDKLAAGESIGLVFVVYYGKMDLEANEIIEATELPKRDLKFNDLSITINYVQAD